MYTRFFGLKQEPFSLAPDPRYLYMSKRHREALAHLLYGVGAGGGFVLLSGEIGAGKTTVCRCFLEQIPKRCNVAYIFNPKLTVLELVKSICDEFRIPPRAETGAPATVKTYVDALNEFLLKTHAVDQNNVLIIDEAQMLSVDVLEQLRLLTNLETNEKKLLQIVLIGQPELRTMLERPELEQLAQRVIARFHLKALSQKETEHYIRHRLSVAGMSRAIPFDRKALQRIFAIARGVPRRINLLCDRAMLGAYAHGKQQIDAAIVEKSAREVFGSSETVAPDRSGLGSGAGFGLVIAAAAALGALLAVGVYSGYRQFTAPGAAAAATPRPGTSASNASTAGAAPASGAGSASSAHIDSTSVSAALAAAAAAEATFAAASSASSATAAIGATTGPSASAAFTAASTASTAAASIVSPAILGPADLKAQLRTLGSDEKSAWRTLASLWHIDPTAADACAAASRQQVRCYKFPATLALLKSLDRPGFLTLRDDSGKSVAVVLVGLGDDSATLVSQDGVTHTVALAALAALWHGEFGTLWRLPPGYTTALGDGATGPLVDRLAALLASIAGEPAPVGAQTLDGELRTKLVRFQSSHGLSAAGKAGPTTFMQINRASGVDEPKLAVAVAGAAR